MTAAKRRPAKSTTAAAKPPMQAVRDEAEAEADPDRRELFEVDGRSFTVPLHPPTNLLIKYLWVAKSNPDGAIMQLLEDLAGVEAVLALIGDPTITPADFGRIVRILEQVATDELRPATGN